MTETQRLDVCKELKGMATAWRTLVGHGTDMGMEEGHYVGTKPIS